METTTNNLVKTLTGTIPENLASFENPIPVSEKSIFTKIITWIIILIIISFLVGSIYIYIVNEPQTFSDFMKSYLKMLGLNEIKEKTKIKKNEDTKKKSINKIETNDNLGKVDTPTSNCPNPGRDKIMKALDNAAQTEQYLADDSSSSIQQSGKSKWCFVGDDKGTRNCVQIDDESQKCMSGDIFPSRDICINPNIRS